MITSDFIITGMMPVESYTRKDLSQGQCQLITVVNKYDSDISLSTKLYAPFCPSSLCPGDEIRLSCKMKTYNGSKTGLPMTYIITHDVAPIRTSSASPFIVTEQPANAKANGNTAEFSTKNEQENNQQTNQTTQTIVSLPQSATLQTVSLPQSATMVYPSLTADMQRKTPIYIPNEP